MKLEYCTFKTLNASLTIKLINYWSIRSFNYTDSLRYWVLLELEIYISRFNKVIADEILVECLLLNQLFVINKVNQQNLFVIGMHTIEPTIIWSNNLFVRVELSQAYEWCDSKCLRNNQVKKPYAVHCMDEMVQENNERAKIQCNLKLKNW